MPHRFSGKRESLKIWFLKKAMMKNQDMALAVKSGVKEVIFTVELLTMDVGDLEIGIVASAAKEAGINPNNIAIILTGFAPYSTLEECFDKARQEGFSNITPQDMASKEGKGNLEKLRKIYDLAHEKSKNVINEISQEEWEKWRFSDEYKEWRKSWLERHKATFDEKGRLLVGAAAGAALLASALPAFATGPENGNFGGNGEAWDNDYGEHYVNVNNGGNRKDWTNHRFAQPGQGGAHANENAAVMEWGDGSLVDPHDTM